MPKQWLAVLLATSLRDRQTDNHMVQGYLLLAGGKKKPHTVNSLGILIKWEAVKDSELCG